MKKIFFFVLALTVMSLTVKSYAVTNLPLKIEGVQVTSGNMADPLDNGIISVKPNKDKSLITVRISNQHCFGDRGNGATFNEPWIDFTGDDTYKTLEVKLTGTWNSSAQVYLNTTCIRTTGDLILSSDAEAFDTGHEFHFISETAANCLEVGGNLTLDHPFKLLVEANSGVGIKMNGTLTSKSGCDGSYQSVVYGKKQAITGIQKFVDDPYKRYVVYSDETHHTYIHDEQAYKPTIANGVCTMHEGSSDKYLFLYLHSQEAMAEQDEIYPISIDGKRLTIYANSVDEDINPFLIYPISYNNKYTIFLWDGANIKNISCTKDVPVVIEIWDRETDTKKEVTIGGRNPINVKGDLTLNCPKDYKMNIINQADLYAIGSNSLITSNNKKVTFSGAGDYVLHQINTEATKAYVFEDCSNVTLNGRIWIDIDRNDSTFLANKATSIKGERADDVIYGYRYDDSGWMKARYVTWDNNNHLMKDNDDYAYSHFHFNKGQYIQYYPFKVAGKQGYSMEPDILGDGSVAYSNNTLHIYKNLTCSGPVVSIYSGTLNLYVNKGVVLKSTDDNCLRFNYSDVTLNIPDGQLQAKVAAISMLNRGTLTFEGGNIQMKGCKYGILGSSGDFTSTVTNHDAHIQIECTDKAISGINEFNLGNSTIQVPEGAHFDKTKKAVVDKSGNIVSNQKVLISTSKATYNLYINDVQVTDDNKANIAEGVSFSYNYANNTGTLTVTPDADSKLKITSKSKDTEGVISPATLLVDAEMGNWAGMTIGSITYYKDLKIQVNGTYSERTFTSGQIEGQKNVTIMEGVKLYATSLYARQGTLLFENNTYAELTGGVYAAEVSIPADMGVVGGTYNSTKKQYVDKNGNIAKKLLFCNKQFPIYVDGTRLTIDNYAQPLANQNVTYDPFTQTIILTDVNYSTNKTFIEFENTIPALCIQFNGNNTITSTQEVIKNINSGAFITTLKLYGGQRYIPDQLNIKSTGKAAISLYDCYLIGQNPNLTSNNTTTDVISIEGATYAVDKRGPDGGISGVYWPERENILLKFKGALGSVNSKIQSGGVYGADRFDGTYLNIYGAPYTGWLWCGRAPFTYGFKVAGVQVTEINSADVLQDGGSVRYEDPYDEYGSNALVLDNATIEAGDSIGLELQKDGWKLYIKGNCTINSRNTGMQLAGSTLYIWNYPDTENHLYINSNGTACSMVANNACHWGVDATLRGHIGLQGIHAAEDAEEAGSCKLRFENDAILTTQGDYSAVVGFDDIDLTDYVILATSEAVYEKGVGVLVDSYYTNEEVTFIPEKLAAVEDVMSHSDSNVQKVIRDGQLLIIRNGKTYNALGNVVE